MFVLSVSHRSTDKSKNGSNLIELMPQLGQTSTKECFHLLFLDDHQKLCTVELSAGWMHQDCNRHRMFRNITNIYRQQKVTSDESSGKRDPETISCIILLLFWIMSLDFNWHDFPAANLLAFQQVNTPQSLQLFCSVMVASLINHVSFWNS